ncbi:MAG: ankyrin repeat domain-containing protein, partial [Bdellovibrionales bacterium]|nr:ankyrin repeat domain-containing protein [Bdellovibrionales bacterium]
DDALNKQLYQAVQFQDVAQIQALASKGADVNHKENGRPILGWAAQNGNVEVVSALLKLGANPNIADEGVGHTPLMRAIDTQFIEIAKTLLNGKADPNAKNQDGESCLMMAVQSGKPELVKALVDGGADVNTSTPEGNTAALYAAQDGSPNALEMIKILGEAKANFNVSNSSYTPLVYATEQGNVELVKALIAAGADVNGKTQLGATPLQSAINYPEVLKILLDTKADPNTVTSYGTPLLLDALQRNEFEVAKVLLQAGADPQKPDQYGNVALEIAERNGASEIAGLIKAENAKKNGTVVADANPGDIPTSAWKGCTIADAARKQMELHGLLQAQVNAGKMSSDIFRTFGDDTKDYASMLSSNPEEACKLFARLKNKYGV